MSAPQHIMAASGRSPLGYTAVACIVITLVMSTWGVLGGIWAVDEADGLSAELTLSHTVAVAPVSYYFAVSPPPPPTHNSS